LLQDFHLNSNSSAIKQGIPLNSVVVSAGYLLNREYVKHQMSESRCATKNPSDLGAYEYDDGSLCVAASSKNSENHSKSSGNSHSKSYLAGFNIILLCVIALRIVFIRNC